MFASIIQNCHRASSVTQGLAEAMMVTPAPDPAGARIRTIIPGIESPDSDMSMPHTQSRLFLTPIISAHPFLHG